MNAIFWMLPLPAAAIGPIRNLVLIRPIAEQKVGGLGQAADLPVAHAVVDQGE